MGLATNPPSVDEDVYFCGYIYTATGLRGTSINLTADIGKLRIINGSGASAIVSAGCECAFFE
jgi:hypothetical protein